MLLPAQFCVGPKGSVLAGETVDVVRVNRRFGDPRHNWGRSRVNASTVKVVERC